MVRKPCAFTLIELLIVMVIIVMLAGLTLTTYSILKERTKRTATESIIAMVSAALSQSAERGGSQAPAEHPLAGSAAPRPLFRRQGATLDETGDALRTRDIAWVPAAKRGRVLLDDDRFEGAGSGTSNWQLPFLVGLKRSHIGIIGTADQRITRWRLVPKPTSRTDLDSDGCTDVDTAGLFDDSTTLQSAAVEDRETATARAVELALGGAALSELTKLKAVQRATASSGTVLCNQMAVSTRVLAAWEPGAVYDPTTASWHLYRIIGTVIVDGWGRELLFSLNSQGAIRLMSAGKDGVFVWHPGKDGVLETGALDTAPAGDDQDGTRDNISSASE
jgi:prepilin-type N-terminal cleavage/methylation domain-containing protein